jgi:hypothetical protein
MSATTTEVERACHEKMGNLDVTTLAVPISPR